MTNPSLLNTSQNKYYNDRQYNNDDMKKMITNEPSGITRELSLASDLTRVRWFQREEASLNLLPLCQRRGVDLRVYTSFREVVIIPEYLR